MICCCCMPPMVPRCPRRGTRISSSGRAGARIGSARAGRCQPTLKGRSAAGAQSTPRSVAQRPGAGAERDDAPGWRRPRARAAQRAGGRRRLTRPTDPGAAGPEPQGRREQRARQEQGPGRRQGGGVPEQRPGQAEPARPQQQHDGGGDRLDQVPRGAQQQLRAVVPPQAAELPPRAGRARRPASRCAAARRPARGRRWPGRGRPPRAAPAASHSERRPAPRAASAPPAARVRDGRRAGAAARRRAALGRVRTGPGLDQGGRPASADG